MKRVVITGASRGIGLALAKTYLNVGWDVVPVVRDIDAAAELVTERERYVEVDLDRLDAVEAALAGRGIGPVDLVFLAAADFGGGAFRFRDFAPDAWLKALRVNLVAPALVARALLPQLDLAPQGKIVLVSTGNASVAGNDTGEMLAYRTSKTALNQLARTMAVELRDAGLIVVAVDPGWVRTRMGGEAAPLSPEGAAYRLLKFAAGLEPHHSGQFLSTEFHPLPY